MPPDFEEACLSSELRAGEIKRVQPGARGVLLIRLWDQLLAYEDRCAHLGLSLSRGELKLEQLTCPAHGWEYNIRTGEGVNPEGVCLRRWPVKEADGKIWVGKA